MINGILGRLYPETGIFSERVHEALDEVATKRTGKKDRRAKENLRLWVSCIKLYMYLQTKFPVEEDWEISDQWIVGVLSAGMDEIKEARHGEIEGLDFDYVWAMLQEAGAIAVVAEVVMLPHLAGKIATLDHLVQRMDGQRRQFQKVEAAHDDLLEDHNELRRYVAEIKKSLENGRVAANKSEL